MKIINKASKKHILSLIIAFLLLFSACNNLEAAITFDFFKTTSSDDNKDAIVLGFMTSYIASKNFPAEQGLILSRPCGNDYMQGKYGLGGNELVTFLQDNFHADKEKAFYNGLRVQYLTMEVCKLMKMNAIVIDENRKHDVFFNITKLANDWKRIAQEVYYQEINNNDNYITKYFNFPGVTKGEAFWNISFLLWGDSVEKGLIEKSIELSDSPIQYQYSPMSQVILYAARNLMDN